MTRTTATVLDKATTIKNYVEDNCEILPAWKVELLMARLDEVLFVVDARDRRATERRLG